MNKRYENISTIYINERCQEILKEKFIEIKKFFLKFENCILNLNIHLIGYNVLHPITKEQLDLKYCENTKENINISVLIDESNLEKYCKELL